MAIGAATGNEKRLASHGIRNPPVTGGLHRLAGRFLSTALTGLRFSPMRCRRARLPVSRNRRRGFTRKKGLSVLGEHRGSFPPQPLGRPAASGRLRHLRVRCFLVRPVTDGALSALAEMPLQFRRQDPLVREEFGGLLHLLPDAVHTHDVAADSS